GPYNSSEVVVLSHKWDKKGTYTISVKAKDVGDYESTWTQLKITMPRNTMPVNFLLYHFLQRLQLLKNKITDFLF
ncbi:MAG: hypothetical protein QHH15_07375, partial [Candidatus Thermoplasmatota archaeon]|nr:hypothetical protein [Candidatus Thermoplasmatota archaeon]